MPSFKLGSILFIALVSAWPAIQALPSAAMAGGAPTGVNLSSGSTRASFAIPPSNVASTGAVLDAYHVVYGVAVPRMHRPTCVSCGDTPFTNFHIQMFVRRLTYSPGGIQVSRQRPLFTGPRGEQIAVFALRRHWLVYLAYSQRQSWQLLARNVVTGRRILLDTSRREALPSLSAHAGTDGRTVVWQTWTTIQGKPASVIRSYSLITGKRHLLLSGGNGNPSSIGDPQISGNRMAFVQENYNQTSEIMLQNIRTGRVRSLTPANQVNYEPAISGNVLVWVHGRLSNGHTHGLVVADLATGRRVALPYSSSQLPQVANGRYVAFSTDKQHVSVQLYDARTGRRRVLAGPAVAGRPGSPVGNLAAGPRAILYYVLNPCSHPMTCASHIVVTRMPRA
ncbi:MAG: TolB family protein [Chloroflexota bacterium]